MSTAAVGYYQHHQTIGFKASFLDDSCQRGGSLFAAIQSVISLIGHIDGRELGSSKRKLQEILDWQEPTIVLKELSAFYYLATHKVSLDNRFSFVANLERHIKAFLLERKNLHENQLGLQSGEIPCGRMHYLLSTFTHILLPEPHGISKAGIFLVRKLLEIPSVALFLESEHHTWILHRLDQLEEGISYFCNTVYLASSLFYLCRLDLKEPKNAPIDQLQIKRWVLQMFLSDILQFDEPNCFAVAGLKYMIANYPNRFLEKLGQALELGSFVIGNRKFRINDFSNLFLVRRAETSKEITASAPSKIPILQDLTQRGVLKIRDIEKGSRVSDCFVEDNSYAAALYCSYYRNVLQLLVIKNLTFLGINGGCQEDYSINKVKIINNWLAILKLEGTRRVAGRKNLLKYLWFLDTNQDCDYGEGPVSIFGQNLQFKAISQKLKSLLKSVCVILYIDDDGTILPIVTVNELLVYLQHMTNHASSVTQDELLSKLKDSLLAEISADSFSKEDLGEVCSFSSLGGYADYCLRGWEIPFSEFKIKSQHIGDTVAEACQAGIHLSEKAQMILLADQHLFTSFCGQRPQKRMGTRKSSLQELVKSNYDPSFKWDVQQLQWRSVLKRLGVRLNKKKITVLSKDISQINKEFNAKEWAIFLRTTLINKKVSVISLEKIEKAIKSQHGALGQLFTADLNWATGLRGHTRLEVESRADGSTTVYQYEKKSGTMYKQTSFNCGRYYLPA